MVDVLNLSLSGGVGYDDVGLVSEGADFGAAEVAVAIEVLPFQVVDVYLAVLVGVVGEGEDFAPYLALIDVVVGVFGLEKGWLPVGFDFLALYGVAGADELAEAEVLEVLGEELGEVAPLGVVAGQEDGLAAEHVGVVFEVGVHLLLNVGVLGVELVVLGRFCGLQVLVGHGR